MRLLFWRASNLDDPTIRLLRNAAADAQRSRIPQMAAALSYRTIFGILPVLAVGLWILHGMVKPQDLTEVIGRGVDALGLSNIAVDPGAAESRLEDLGSEWFMGPPRPKMLPAPPGTAVSTASVQQWINELVARVDKISFAAIGGIGIATLLYAAISMIVEIERAFNQIYRVPRGRSWARRIVNYWALLTLGTVGLFATFAIQSQLGTFVEKWTHGHTGLGSGQVTLTLLGFATQWIISAAVLLLLYTSVPNTRVRFVPALIAALLAAVVFEASKFAFGKYVEFSAGMSYARLYGSLALIPLFLLWVYFSWLIVLFGVQLSYQIQHGRGRTRAQPIIDAAPAFVDPSAVLSIMSALARGFQRGATLDAPALASLTRLPDTLVRIVLVKLTERSLVHRLDSHDSTAPELADPSYALARPPASVRVADLLQLGLELAGNPGAPADPIIGRLHRAQLDAAGAETLATILESAPPHPTSNGQLPSPATAASPAADRPIAAPRRADPGRVPTDLRSMQEPTP